MIDPQRPRLSIVRQCLLLHLNRQQAQKIGLAERRVAPAGGRRSGGVIGDCGYGHFILLVSSISCLAVDSASTMFWYWRELSSISTISAF